jgi:hypothetical protein
MGAQSDAGALYPFTALFTHNVSWQKNIAI